MKKLFILLIVFMFVFPLSVFASDYNYGYFGTSGTTSFLYADSSAYDDVWLDLSVSGNGSGFVDWYGFSGVLLSSSSVPNDNIQAPSGAIGFKLRSTGGGEIYCTIGHTTNPLSSTVNFSKPENEALLNAMYGVKNQIQGSFDDLYPILNDIRNQITPTVIPTKPNKPSVPSLSDNKPVMPSQAFVDTSQHFSDTGEAQVPDELPQAPEPDKDWKDSDGNAISKEEPIAKEPVLQKDDVPQKDDVSQKDDVLQKDDVPQKDDVLVRDDVLQPDDSLQRDEPTVLDSVDDSLPRWKSY